uniref:Venom polypeptide n=1 Tax=Dolopus genitalis TaxID=2488630 RepID=A0A3G5BIC4_DOLGE|nr:venom polypeptide [Dolopus genitalis]
MSRLIILLFSVIFLVAIVNGRECPTVENEKDIAVHLPHKDCSKYYACVKGKKIERKCPRGLLFNKTLQVCDFPERVKC